MRDVHVGVIGLGNVGSGTLAILAANADQIALKLGFRLHVAAVCSRSLLSKTIAGVPDHALRTSDWMLVV
jgi:homoserine dehydrogenase